MTQKKTTFVKQAAILGIAGIVVRIIGFLYRLPLTNKIGDEGNAIYANGFYLYTFFLIMSSAGFPAAISKMVSERIAFNEYKNAYKVFKVALLVAGFLGLLSSLALYFGAGYLSVAVDNPESYYSIITLSPTVFIVSIMAVYRGYFQGMNNSAPTAISQVIEQIFNAFFSVYLAFILMEKTNDVAISAAGGTAGTGIGAVAGLICLFIIYLIISPKINKKMKTQEVTKKETSLSIAKEIIKTSFPIIVGTAIFSITNLIDMKMVSSRLLSAGMSELVVKQEYGKLTGKYATLTTLPVSISTAIATAVIPNIASSIARNEKLEAIKKINIALRLTMILSIPAAVGIGVLGDAIILMLFPQYPEGGELLRIGSISIIFLALAQITTGMLQGTGHVKVPAIAAFIGGLFKIPFNYYLISIPSIGVSGAVISTIVCYVVASSVDLIVLKKIIGKEYKLDLVGGLVKPLMASVVMGLCCYSFYNIAYMIIPSNTIACIIAIIIGMASYFSYMLIIKGIKLEDLMMIPMGGKIANALTKIGAI